MPIQCRMLDVGQKVLVTTQQWFFGPDGAEYRAVFGTVKGIFSDEETLGIKTNRGHTNWYARIGGVVIAGCQIQYVCAASKCPGANVPYWMMAEGKVVSGVRPSSVLNADAI